MIFSVFGAICEFERNRIRERVLAGQQRAKTNGVRYAVKLLFEKGIGIKQIAKELQIGVGTVHSVI